MSFAVPIDKSDSHLRLSPFFDVTSKSSTHWCRQFSPFHLGPISLYQGLQSQNMENAWQYSKVYRSQLDSDGYPSADWKSWAQAGWNSPYATRYPMGKGAKPEYLFWNGLKLGYTDAKRLIYLPLYASAVMKTPAWERMLQELYSNEVIYLWDYDSFNFYARGLTFEQAIQENRPMGHAMVLAWMLNTVTGQNPPQGFSVSSKA